MPDRSGTAAVARSCLGLLGLAGLVAGCAGVPASGPVHTGRLVAAGGGIDAEPDVRVLPQPPHPGMSPTDLVVGFLHALVDNDGGYETARQFLTRRAAAGWDPNAAVTTYDDSALRVSAVAGSTPTGRTVRISAPRFGVIDRRGDFTPEPSRVRETMQLVRVGGQWRIDRLPSGVLLTATDAERSYRLADVYYVNRAATALVPEQVLVQPDPRSLATALVRALVTGPGSWLAPAVRTAFPHGTDLLGNVPVTATGIAEVNLTAAVRQASAQQLRLLSAQLFWTLRQVGQIRSLRLSADGAALALPGRSPGREAALVPDRAPVGGALYEAGGGWQRLSASGGRSAGLPAGIVSARLTADGQHVAAVRLDRRRATLLYGRPRQRLAVVDRALAFTLPTFDATGDVVSVRTTAAGSSVVAISPTGAVRRWRAALPPGPVQRLALSPDGARVAAVVGPVGGGQLVVGRVALVHGRPVLDGFRPVLSSFVDVRGLSWDGSDELMVTAAVGGGRDVVAVDVDGYAVRTIATSGVRGEPVDVAAASGRPLVVATDSGLWSDRVDGSWRRVGAGSDPSYPG
jgi:hypothetical protein